MLTLLDNSNSQASSTALYNHAKVAAELAHEILANPKDNKELCKVLNYCNVTEDDQDLIKVIEFLLEELMEDNAIQKDKLIHKGITKFAATLQRADKNPDVSLTPSKVEKIRDKVKLISDSTENLVPEEEPKSKRKAQRKAPQKKAPQKKTSQKKSVYKSER